MSNLFQTLKIESGFINNEETINALKNNIQVSTPEGTNHLLITWDFSTIINTANLSYRSEVATTGGIGFIKSNADYDSSPPTEEPNALVPIALFEDYPTQPAFRIKGFELNGDISYSIIIEDMADLNERDDQFSILQNPQQGTPISRIPKGGYLKD